MEHTHSWDNVVTPFQLPPKFELMLGDVDAGSHTPSLVGKVLAWRKSKPEEGTLLVIYPWLNLFKLYH